MIRTLFACLLALSLTSQAIAADTTKVRIQTTEGNIVVELNAKKAPKTVANFLSYVDKGFYKGTIFHRVIPNFMIQGGGMTANMQRKTTQAPIPLEAKNGLKNDRGTIAMARTNNPNSATSQFFINTVNNGFLNASASSAGYTVFGKVVEGLKVVDKIGATQTQRRANAKDVPVKTIEILSVERLETAATAVQQQAQN